ncbi:tRNA (adenosine(37)-N6)-threonylcarbamoyltransferase complex transferase subunit TsaD [Candidatus Babela massiliensis]|uniref:tRNA N6-adenosine threonylcarbamoyltransferase n=1 Tax=Candidatus Babela massiliensis TaxID=673862 RepID=V6DGY4_9BACT|nr:tRNA (adenosine(37)-N6)-threonylcarbamoyltransferase complex transferase subunit TsaD [Candidatus Babela massiliensis]CDK30857.1 t(6)A37 threonylcarbamoyladenosine biosynthesis protein [Candidatus Babela massiliensis]
MPKILAIESSCDDTGAAVYVTENKDNKMLSSVLYSQIKNHKKFGGVVPEIASRSHLEKIRSIVESALNNAQTSLDNIDIIAVTHKPGLPGSLLVGLSFAKALAWSKGKKLIGVNHLEGHIFSACIENNIPFPFLCITASGGHTALYIVHDYGKFELLGQTLDDAAGEAFDKVSKLIGLEYPGGPIIEQLAKEVNFQDYFDYPRAMPHSYNFSFSGLKTAVLYDLIKKGAYDPKEKKLLNHDLYFKKQVSSSLLNSISDIFKQKIILALKNNINIKAVAFVGGVACNQYIRQKLQDVCNRNKVSFFTPSPKYCTDNAAMIAYVANYKALNNQYSDFSLDIY